MYNSFTIQVLDAIHDLLQIFERLLRRQLSFLQQVVMKIKIAQLSNNIHVVAGLIHVMQFDDIIVEHLLHYVNFRLNIF
jgi:hypothetical protein